MPEAWTVEHTRQATGYVHVELDSSCWTSFFLVQQNLNTRHYSLSQHVSTCAFVVKLFNLVPTEAVNQIACPAMHWYCCPFHLLPYIPRGTQKSNVHSYSPFIADSILSNSIKILTASSSTESGIWRKSVNRVYHQYYYHYHIFLYFSNASKPRQNRESQARGRGTDQHLDLLWLDLL